MRESLLGIKGVRASIPEGENSMCKGPEVGRSLALWGSLKKASVAGEQDKNELSRW